jgi:hypothetical protein
MRSESAKYDLIPGSWQFIARSTTPPLLSVFTLSFTAFFSASPAPSTTCVYFIGARRQGSHDERRLRSALDRCAPLKTLDLSRVSRRKKSVFKGVGHDRSGHND